MVVVVVVGLDVVVVGAIVVLVAGGEVVVVEARVVVGANVVVVGAIVVVVGARVVVVGGSVVVVVVVGGDTSPSTGPLKIRIPPRLGSESPKPLSVTRIAIVPNEGLRVTRSPGNCVHVLVASL